MQLLIIQLILSGFIFSSGILKTHGRVIVNDSGEKVVLKGFGLGGWVVLEGYMWNYPGFGSTTTMGNAVEYIVCEKKRWN